MKVGDLVRFRLAGSRPKYPLSALGLGIVTACDGEKKRSRFSSLVTVHWPQYIRESSHYENDLEVISESR